MIYILYGANTYSRSKELANIKQSLGDPDMLSINTCTLNGNQVSVNEIKDICQTAPFLNPNRLVIIEGYIGRFEPNIRKKSGKKGEDLQQDNEYGNCTALVEYVKQLPAKTMLIFVEDVITLHNPLMKLLSPLVQIKNFPLLREHNLAAWITTEIKNGGGNISPGATKLLINTVGNDLWTLHNEIEKLLSFCHGHLINEDDIKKITSYSREISIFNIVDNIIEKKIAEAQQLIKLMAKEGSASVYILTMILRQLRLIIMAKYLEKGVNTEEALAKLGLHSEFALDKTLKQSKTYTIEQLQGLYERLLDIDVSTKTGRYTSEIELDIMIYELCR